MKVIDLCSNINVLQKRNNEIQKPINSTPRIYEATRT